MRWSLEALAHHLTVVPSGGDFCNFVTGAFVRTCLDVRHSGKFGQFRRYISRVVIDDASTLRISSIDTALFMENQKVTSEGLKEGQITGNLEVIKCLQEGQFGRVFQVMDIRSQREFVTKEMKSDQDLAKSEVSIHRNLTHPNVIQFFEVRWEDDLVYIDMELAASCLYDVLYVDRHVLFDGWQYFHG